MPDQSWSIFSAVFWAIPNVLCTLPNEYFIHWHRLEGRFRQQAASRLKHLFHCFLMPLQRVWRPQRDSKSFSRSASETNGEILDGSSNSADPKNPVFSSGPSHRSETAIGFLRPELTPSDVEHLLAAQYQLRGCLSLVGRALADELGGAS